MESAAPVGDSSTALPATGKSWLGALGPRLGSQTLHIWDFACTFHPELGEDPPSLEDLARALLTSEVGWPQWAVGAVWTTAGAGARATVASFALAAVE